MRATHMLVDMWMEVKEDLEKAKTKWWSGCKKNLRKWGEIWLEDTQWDAGSLKKPWI